MKSPLLVIWLTLAGAAFAQLPFTYETDAVMSSSGDFGVPDGLKDVIIVDRATGNIIIGKQSAGGSMTWTTPEPGGITGVTGLAVDRFNGGTSDVAAVAAPAANRITIAALSSAATQLSFRHVHPTNPSPRALASFDANADGIIDLMVVGQQNASPFASYYEMLTNVPSTATTLWQSTYGVEISRIHRFVQKTGTTPILAENFGNIFYVDSITASGFGAARGLFDSPIDANTLMTYGPFDGTAYSQVILYNPGSTTAKAAKVIVPTAGNFAWAASTTLTFPKAVKQLVTLNIAAGGARLGVLFTDQTAAVYSFDGTTLALRSTLVGAPFDWLNPLENDILIAKNNLGWRRYNSSFNNANLSPTHAGSLADFGAKPRVSNVIFFSGEPFADAAATPLAQGSIREWSTGVSGSGTSWTVTAAAVSAAGIGTPASSAYTTPVSSTHGLPNQYRAAASTHGLEAGTGSIVLDLSIRPPGGVFRPLEEFPVTFSPTSYGANVRYRVNNGPWQFYSIIAPPRISLNSTVEAYAFGSAGKSPIRSVTYSFSAAPSLSVGTSPDLDGDGLPDAWEKSFNLNDPSGDADGDGVDNLGEYLSGTDPRDPGNTPPFEFVLRMERSGLAGGTLRLSWDQSLGNVILESNTTLSGAWLPVTDSIVTENTESVRYFTIGAGNPSARFFRLRRP